MSKISEIYRRDAVIVVNYYCCGHAADILISVDRQRNLRV